MPGESNLTSRHIFIFLIIAFLLAVTIAAATLSNDWQLLATGTDTASTSSASGLEIVTSNGLDELSMLRGCAEDEILKMNAANLWACGSDVTSTATGVGVVVLDLGDDAANESTAIEEIATTGDTNSIFTEPAANKLLIAVGNAWPTATALAANPTDCAATQFASAIAASGNLTCAQPNFTDLAGAATDGQVPDTITISLAATATALAANPADCAADTKADAIAASGALTCTAVDTGDITNGTILDVDLNADVPNNGECLTFLATGAGVFRWNPCGSGGGNSFETISTSGGTSPVADSATDTLILTGTAPITVTGDAAADSVTIACATCVTGVRGGAGIASSGGTTPDITTASGETDFLASGALTCGAGTQGRMQVHTTALQYCDNDGGDTLRYAAYGSSSGVATSATVLAANGGNCAAASYPLGVDASGAAESCTVAFYQTVQDEGGALAQRTIIDFVGAGVSCADSGGTKTLCTIAGGGSANSFETLNVITGTDPVADSATDTLNLDDSITISVSGAAATDSLSWHLVSPTCADSSGQHLNFSAGVLVCGTTTGNAPALAANGGNCSAGSAPLGVDAAGAVESCFDVEEEANIGTTVITGNAADDQVLLGSGASAATWASVADCNTNNRDRVQYDTATNAFSCDSDTLLDADVDDTITVGNGGTVDADALACDVGDDNLISEDCIGANTLDTTEIAGLDISDDTNLTAGRSLTLTGDDVLADAELYTDTKNINITSPTTGVTNLVQFTFALPATIGQVACSVDTGTLTIQFDERAQATPNTAGANIMTSSLVCDTNSQVTTAFDNAAIAADAPVNLQVTAVSGTPTIVRIHVRYAYDD